MYDAIHLTNFVLCCACAGLKLWESGNSLDDFARAEDTPLGSEKSCTLISSHVTATSLISCASGQCFAGGTLFQCWNGSSYFWLDVEQFHDWMHPDKSQEKRRLSVMDIDFQAVLVHWVGSYTKTVVTIEVAEDDGTTACDIEVGECHRLVAKKADSPKGLSSPCNCKSLSHLPSLRHHAVQCEGCTAVTARDLIERFRQHEESGHEKDGLMCSDGKLRSICNATARTNREKVWKVVFEDPNAIVEVHAVRKGKPLDLLEEFYRHKYQLHVLAFGDLNRTRRGGQRQKPDTGLEHAGDP